MPESSSSSSSENTKYRLCEIENLNVSSALSPAAAPQSGGSIKVGGKTYDSKEDLDANELPRDVIMGKPNVVAAFAGTKTRNGVDTGEPCIVVGVVKKDSSIPEVDRVPKTLSDGVITDIVEMPKIYASSACLDGVGGGCYSHADRHRPMVGGISAIVEGATACTLGLFVKDSSDGSIVALTNNHCVGLLYDSEYSVPTYGSSSVVGGGMLQPSPSDGGDSEDEYGTVKRAVAIQFGTDSTQSNLVDCAVSTSSVDDADQSILDINGGPFPFASKSEYSVGTQIVKSGRTTGETPPPTTSIISKNANINVDYGNGSDNDIASFSNQIMYQAGSRFSQGGDSGSAVIAVIDSHYKVVGLHFAGNSSGTIGIANHIEDVSEALNVEAWNGDIITAHSLADSISVNGRCYYRVGDTSDEITHSVGQEYSDCDECAISTFDTSSSSSSSSESSVSQSESSVSSLSTIAFSTSSDTSSSSVIVRSSRSSESSSSSVGVQPGFSSNSPKGFIYEMSDEGEVVLSWRSYQDATKYVVEKRTNSSSYQVIFDSDEDFNVQSALSYIDSDVVFGVFYSYRIRAVHRHIVSGEKTCSLYTYSANSIFIPAPPEDLIATTAGGTVFLSWSNNSQYEAGFSVERKYSDGEYNSIYVSRPNEHYFTDIGPFNSDEYSYRVKAFISLENQSRVMSSPSNEVSLEVADVSKASERSDVTVDFSEVSSASLNLSDSLTVSVNNHSDSETYYWRYDDSLIRITSYGYYAKLFPIRSGDISITVERKSDNELAAIDVAVSATDITRIPSGPTNLRAESVGNHSAEISWRCPSNYGSEISHYNVYRATDRLVTDANDLSKNLISSVPNFISRDIFSYTDEALNQNTEYYYSVMSVSIFGKTSSLSPGAPVGDGGVDLVVSITTGSEDVSIDPHFSLVPPGGSTTLGVKLNSPVAVDAQSWEISENNSGSELKVDVSKFVHYEASSKWISKDVIKLIADDREAYSKIIVTRVI